MPCRVYEVLLQVWIFQRIWTATNCNWVKVVILWWSSLNMDGWRSGACFFWTRNIESDSSCSPYPCAADAWENLNLSTAQKLGRSHESTCKLLNECMNLVRNWVWNKFESHFALQSVHKVLPSTIFCITKLSQRTSQYYVLQKLRKVFPSLTWIQLIIIEKNLKRVRHDSETHLKRVFLVESLRVVFSSLFSYFNHWTKYFPISLCIAGIGSKVLLSIALPCKLQGKHAEQKTQIRVPKWISSSQNSSRPNSKFRL